MTLPARFSVAQRVSDGGHDIPRDVIVRLYRAGLRNLLELYLPLADTAEICDNSDGSALLVASKTRRTGLVIHDRLRWAQLEDGNRWRT